MSIWALLADLVAYVHAGYVLFVVGGLLLILIGIAFRWQWVRNFWFRALHLLAIVIVAVEALTGVNCPLTDLERILRIQAEQSVYHEDFLVYWAHRLLFIESIPQWVFDTGHVAFGLLVLAVFIVAPPRWPFTKQAATPQPLPSPPPG
jgi:multisubunit Na+/H+ antiporter MnhB subunit